MLPPRPESAPTPATGPRDTVRINLPTRPPSGVPARPPAPANPTPPTVAPSAVPAVAEPAVTAKSSFLPPSSGASQTAAMRAPEPVAAPPSPLSPGPKKETARITVLPDPPKSSGSVQMKKTQPLISMPETRAPVTPVTVAPVASQTKLDAIPMSLCWALVGVSAAILLIQIWTYLS